MELLRLPAKRATHNEGVGMLRICARVEELPELERIAQGIINVLKRYSGYEPEIDDILVYRIATTIIYSRRTESFLDAPTADEKTYTRIIDVQAKQQSMIENALAQLALSRRDRLSRKEEADITAKLRQAIADAKNS